ncbi:hypothetical protein evm_007412 [Chilo suppressalis]|nr:hypothetical protein evm_007412 [Chilo suppressalis]
MPSCVFRWCTNYTGTVRDKGNISFHSLPKDVLIREKWVNIIRTQRCDDYWMPTTYSTVCSEHFLTSDIYTTKKNQRRLTKTAVPVMMKEEQYAISSPSSLQNVDLSDEDSIFVSHPNIDITYSKAVLIEKVKKEPLETPRLQFNNYNLIKKNKRLKEKCNTLKKVVSELQRKKYFTIDQIRELSLKAEAVDFANRLVQKSKFNSFRQKHTPALRKFAVTLYYYSAAAYKYVRKTFNGYWPHPRGIGKWYQNSSGDPGFNKQALKVLEKKHKINGQRMLCALVADEMALRHQTSWTGKRTAGIVDFGAGTANSYEIATQAYMFTLVCLNDNWKIPLAYFLVNVLSAETRASLLKICLSECYRVGVDIVAITFDDGPSNINAANLLGCNLNRPESLKTTFKHPECDTEVAIMLDACHMIKLVRNTFEAKKLIYDTNGKQIRWQLLKNLLKLQTNVELNFTNKITPRHIHFRNEIIKIKLATQIMSMSVANALKLCNEILTSSLFVNTEGTTEFITIFNNLFDIFNSQSSDLYGLKKPLSIKNADEIFAFLDKAKRYILGLKICIKYKRTNCKQIRMIVTKKKIVETKNKTGFLGFLVCIESLKHLYSTLVEGQRLRHIATHRLSQYHIEMLFDTISRHGGYNSYPNAIHFKGIFKKALQRLETKSSFFVNCVPLEDIYVLPCSSAIEKINSSVLRSNDEELYTLEGQNLSGKENDDSLLHENVEVLATMLNRESVKKTINLIIGYISGWVSIKLVKSLKCYMCTSCLLSDTKLWFHKLIIPKHMGGLCFSSQDVFQICLKSEAVIKNHIKQKLHIVLSDPKEIAIIKNRILKSFLNRNDVFSSLNSHSLEQYPTFNHRLHLIRAIIEEFTNVRIHFAHKNNLDFNTDYKRLKRNKLSLFERI